MSDIHYDLRCRRCDKKDAEIERLQALVVKVTLNNEQLRIDNIELDHLRQKMQEWEEAEEVSDE